VRGAGATAILYFDLACPRCAGLWTQIAELPLQVCVRHFPVSSKRPRSPALHAAAEAVGLQSADAFWPFWDSLISDRAHTDDPHLWERVENLGLDLDRFESDRRSEEVAERVRRDFRSGIRAGVTATPSAFFDGRPIEGDLVAGLRARC
jgi:protein-disulfide isomerase